MQLLPRIIISTSDYQRIASLLDAVDFGQYGTHEQLWTELDRADLVEPSAMPPDVVSMNSRVRFRIDGEESREMTLCYPKDVNSSGHFVSVLAPIGSALLGMRVGQEIEWRLPGGRTKKVLIEAVNYQPERAGDFSA
ncbi:MAG TPA: nucleoside diphosphate kinase regulator [Polyangiaceae bacterium]|nr:nucleoside diphosphate kinase regulator [Polyangiaceae bacterium]